MPFNSPIFETLQGGRNVKSTPLVVGAKVVVQSFLLLNLQIIVVEFFAFAKRLMPTKLVLLFSLAVLVSCDPVQNKLESTAAEIESAENNLAEMSAEDWTKLEISMGELKQDLELNRNDYSEEQIKEAGRIQGNYAALVMKKGINDIKESVEDFGNQMEGFIEGINSDTTNN